MENLLSQQDNKPVVFQSWQLTKVKYKFNKTEKNIFLKIIEIAQKHLNKENLGKKCTFEMTQKFGKEYPQITFPIRDLLKNSNNYKYVCDSLDSLGGKSFGMPASTDWDFQKCFLFSKVSASENKGIAMVELTPAFWEAFLNTETYKSIDPHLEYKFDSVYTMRMYELLVGNKKPITYKIANLIDMFCLEKYTASQFITYVIQIAQKEMKEMDECPFFFEYEVTKEGRKFDKLTFTLVYKNSAQTVAALGMTGDVKLSQNIESGAKFMFGLEEISKSLYDKLLKLQVLIGEKPLEMKLKDVFMKTSAMKEDGTLNSDPVAYLSACLDNLYNVSVSNKVKQQAQKQAAQDIEIIDTVETFASDEPELSPKEKCYNAILLVKQDSEYMQKIAAHHEVSVSMMVSVLDRIQSNADLSSTWANDDSVEKVKKHLLNAKTIIDVIKNSSQPQFQSPMTVSSRSQMKRKNIEVQNKEDYYEW